MLSHDVVLRNLSQPSRKYFSSNLSRNFVRKFQMCEVWEAHRIGILFQVVHRETFETVGEWNNYHRLISAAWNRIMRIPRNREHIVLILKWEPSQMIQSFANSLTKRLSKCLSWLANGWIQMNEHLIILLDWNNIKGMKRRSPSRDDVIKISNLLLSKLLVSQLKHFD